MNFATFDLNLLRVFDAVFREGTTVKAGQQLGMSQSAVSGALSRLRYSIGDELFVRQGQGLKPTDYARALATPVREELDRLEAILSGPAAFDPASASLTFKLSGSDFFAEILMPRLADVLRRIAPGVRLQLVDLVHDNYVDKLDRYEVDMALIPDIHFPDWVDSRPLFYSDFIMIARKDHPEIKTAGVRSGEKLPLDLYCQLGHVVCSPEGNLAAMGDVALERIGRQRHVAITVPGFAGVCRCVSESDLIALVPEQLVAKVAPSMDLELYPTPMQIDPPLLVAIWHKRSTGNPAHKWLRDLIADMLIPLNEGERHFPE